MKQKINLTESEFRNLVSQRIQEALQDEGVWGGLKNMFNKGMSAAKDAYQQGSQEQDKKNAFDKCVKYYQKNRDLFAKVNKMKGQIKQMANKYGFSVQDVAKAANGEI